MIQSQDGVTQECQHSFHMNTFCCGDDTYTTGKEGIWYISSDSMPYKHSLVILSGL